MESLRALFGNVMLDVAWALFDMRMLRDPDADPNALMRAWTIEAIGPFDAGNPEWYA